MFERHKCKCEKIKEVKVYNTKEVQELYHKVFAASDEMDFLKCANTLKREIIKHTETFTLKLEKNTFHLFLVQVNIHNQVYKFVLDTGAQISGIMSKHQDLIHTYENEQKITIKSASGNQKEMQTICLDRFFLGSLEIKNQSFVVLEHNHFQIPLIKKDIMEFDGIIGWDILSQLDFEIDTKKKVFSVIESEDMFTYCNLIQALFPVVIVYNENKKPAIFGIDSGAKGSWLSEKYSQDNDLKIIREIRGMNVGVLGLEAMHVQLIKECSLSLFETNIKLENIRSGQTQVFMNLALDGIFGNEIFKNKKIQFLNSKGIVRIL